MVSFSILVLVILLQISYQYQYNDRVGTTCFSQENESGGISASGRNHAEAIRSLRRYEDCETIIGNVIVMNIHDPTGTETQFLYSIRKITGYLVISYSNLTVLPFPNLEIISGQNLANYLGVPKLALFVSYINGTSHPGLNNLKEVSNGDVRFETNHVNLSVYSESIQWDDIVLNGLSFIEIKEPDFNPADFPCHTSCKYPGKCWGPNRESCQLMSMQICQSKCPGRCYYKENYDEPFCCHKECAGGCSGTSNVDCFGCRNFNATGECVTQCPTPMRYDKKLFQNVPNEKVLYSLGNECLKKCPGPYLTEEGNCVKKCSQGMMAGEHTSLCVPCPLEGCPKRCPGFSSTTNLKDKDMLGICSDRKKGRKCSTKFMQLYTNCTIIEGDINIDDKFSGKFSSPDALEVLSTVEEITGYLSIVTNSFFYDFKFLRNLKRIKGITLKSSSSCQGGGREDTCETRLTLRAALTIQGVDFTNTAKTKTMLGDSKLRELRLNSLSKIDNGMVIIMAAGSPLCYLPDKASFVDIMGKADLIPDQDILIKYNKTYCGIQEYKCHDECLGGCWGPGPSNCVKCYEHSFEGQCVTGCNSTEMQGLAIYEDKGKVCKRCHPECDPAASCLGPGHDKCNQCKNYKDGPYCVPECPAIKYANTSGICVECHAKCIEEMGCTGPNSSIGDGGCNFCPVVRLMEEKFTTANGKRIGQCEADCEPGQYADNLRPYQNLPTHDLSREERVKVCMPCNPSCSSCLSSGVNKYECTCKFSADGEICVDKCPPGKYRSLLDKTCRPCVGECPNNCHGSDTIPLNNTSIMDFVNCDLVEGSVIIDYRSWSGVDPITAASLEALDEIVKITGRLIIRDSPDPDFTNLDMLRRVEAVLGEGKGRSKRDVDYVLEITNNSALLTAELVSLKELGGAMKLGGDSLCYVDTIDWSGRYGNRSVDVAISTADCINKTCHSECSPEGCLGPVNDMCISCSNKEFLGRCHGSCIVGSYDDGESSICKPCHNNCITCTGGGNQHCLLCNYVMDGSACVRKCNKKLTYETRERRCEACHNACNGGCTGPQSHLGIGGCDLCKMHDTTRKGGENNVEVCTHTCPPKSFQNIEYVNVTTTEIRTTCVACHPQCSKCKSEYDTGCEACLNVRQGDRCQERCNDDYYPNEDYDCTRCHSHCETCIGPGPGNCTKCKHFELPDEEVSLKTKKCVEECPPQFAYQKSGGDGNVCAESCGDEPGVQRDDDYCNNIPGRTAPNTGSNKNTVAVATTVGVTIVLFFILVIIICWKRTKQNQKKRDTLLKHAQHMHEKLPNPIYEPVLQDDTVYPSDGELLIVTEDKLEIGEVLGSGAFGKVYEGRWNPSETHRGYRVAIKILKESGDPESTREFFDEAVVMGKLDHKHLVRILCLNAGKMMLVTQLMPLGSLLDYVRKYRHGLTAHHMLTYGYQIAKGMTYLEENNVVHRDLAARNVLVQTPTFVKITDFGLAKMLSRKEHTFTSEGGKLPIKWLAIESLKYRHFTPRSDTWSYGVTMWEVLEFGSLPWRTKPPTDLIRALEMGERLSKPKICSLEVYAVMLRCWVLEPTARPNFEDLMDSMEEYLKEPNRFVHINHRASTEGSFLSPHASVTSEHRDSGIVAGNYENDDRAMAIERALYDATSSLRPHESLHYDPALTADQDDVFSDSPSTARNSVVDVNRHDYVQDYLVPDQYSVDEGNGTDNSSQDQGYVKMNGSDGQYTDLEPAPEYSNTDDLTETGITQALLEHKPNNKQNKNKYLPNRTPSPRMSKSASPNPAQNSPRVQRLRDDGYSSLKEPFSDVEPLTRDL